jgi:dihydrofolate synthase/folylpolyglutamate synthase
VPLVTQHYDPMPSNRVKQIATEVGAPWFPRSSLWHVSAERDAIRYRDSKGELLFPLPRLPGAHQALNAGLAIAMLRHQDQLDVGERALGAAMVGVEWPARLQKLSAGPLVQERDAWLDGGHNAEAAVALASAMRLKAPFTLIVGCLRTKDARGLLEPFRGLAAEVLTVPVPDQECVSPGELAAVADALEFRGRHMATLGEAVNQSPTDKPLLIAGSLYLAGEVLRLNGEVVS